MPDSQRPRSAPSPRESAPELDIPGAAPDSRPVLQPLLNQRPPPLSRIYLLPAVLVLVLGAITLVYRLRQPSYPALPGRGCLVVTFPSPDSTFLPVPYLELDACVYISRSILELTYYPGTITGGTRLFDASVEEDPRRWAKVVGIQWLNRDTIEVRYRTDVRFTRRDTAFKAGHVIYAPLR